MAMKRPSPAKSRKSRLRVNQVLAVAVKVSMGTKELQSYGEEMTPSSASHGLFSKR